MELLTVTFPLLSSFPSLVVHFPMVECSLSHRCSSSFNQSCRLTALIPPVRRTAVEGYPRTKRKSLHDVNLSRLRRPRWTKALHMDRGPRSVFFWGVSDRGRRSAIASVTAVGVLTLLLVAMPPDVVNTACCWMTFGSIFVRPPYRSRLFLLSSLFTWHDDASGIRALGITTCRD